MLRRRQKPTGNIERVIKIKNKIPENAIKIENDNETMIIWQVNTNIYIRIFAGTGDNINFDNIKASSIIDKDMFSRIISKELL